MVRTALIVSVIVSAVLLGSAFLKPHNAGNPEPSPAPGSNSSPIVVELFTSEGCSSCPPADKLLADLDRDATYAGAPLIALGEHVDYWDGLGWKDRFSSAQFTERQRQFGEHFSLNSVYTPQMVVDGRLELVGNDQAALKRALDKAAASPKPVNIELAWDAPGALHVTAHDTGKHRARVFLVVTETNLTTTVQRGENGGRVLHHAAVVRHLEMLRRISDSHYTTRIPVPVNSEWKPDNSKLVVFVQDESTGAILGAKAIPYPKI